MKGLKSKKPIRHGKPPGYVSWCHMRQRCYDPNCQDYPDYGGVGVRVYEGWLDDFVAFITHIGPRPSRRHSIDRIDRTRDYEPGNVRWATPRVQALNRSTTRWVTFRGQTRCIKDWAQITGISRGTITQRLDYGWSAEEALTRLPDKRRSCKQGWYLEKHGSL